MNAVVSTTLETPIGHVVAEHPQIAPLLERLGVHYCCGGEKSLQAACQAAGVEPREVLAEVAQIELRRLDADEADWLAAPLSDLCDHIERKHHAYLRRQLPLLEKLLQQALSVEGAGQPALLAIRDALAALREALMPHLKKEERILFPAIRAKDHARQPESIPLSDLECPIHVMEREHAQIEQALGRLREAAACYSPPSHAGNGCGELLAGLEELERDLHLHIHKENNILFPRAMHLAP